MKSRQGPPARDGAAAPAGGEATLSTPWGDIHSRFLASLGPAERAHVFELGGRAAEAVQRWAARYPSMRGVRVVPLCLSVAAGAPFSSVDAVVSAARQSLWVFTLDDQFDEECAPEHELMRRAEEYRAIAQARLAHPPSHDLAEALREVRQDLTTYPLFGPLGTEWAAALCGTIDGMLREYAWRAEQRQAGGQAVLPSYAEYVATGRYSIGGPPHMWAAIVTADDPSAPRHLEHLRAMEELASTSIRLANDLQSYDKELAEGNVNGPIILGHSLIRQAVPPALAAEQAKQRVRDDMAGLLDRLSGLRRAAVTLTGRPEAAMDNIARFVCDFYAHHDYHTFTGQAA